MLKILNKDIVNDSTEEKCPFITERISIWVNGIGVSLSIRIILLVIFNIRRTKAGPIFAYQLRSILLGKL